MAVEGLRGVNPSIQLHQLVIQTNNLNQQGFVPAVLTREMEIFLLTQPSATDAL